MSAVGLVLGGGGITGAAYEMAALMAIEMATGWDSNQADVVVGTSSGMARGQRRVVNVGGTEWTVADGEDDLPCPWCYSPTASSDSRCPSCDRRFG